MKKVTTLSCIILSYVLFFAPQAKASETGCSELFISEILFSKVNNENSFNLNYAVELFNSSNNTISLSNYSIELITDLGVHTTINLSGTVASHETHVLTNSNATLDLQNLSNQLSADFNLENNAFLELKKGSTVIDKIGQNGTSAGAIDLQQLAADPYNYLLGRSINLDDFYEISLKRGLFITEGDPTFIGGGSMFGKWGYSLNNLTGDIGQHECLCTRTEAQAMVGWYTGSENVGERNTSNDTDPLHLNINGISSANTTIQQTGVTLSYSKTVGNAEICNTTSVSQPELGWQGINNVNSYCQSISFLTDPGVLPEATASVFYDADDRGKELTLELSSSNSAVISIDWASNIHKIKLDWPTNVNTEQPKKAPKIYPTTFVNKVYISSENNLLVDLYTVTGSKVMEYEHSNGISELDLSNLDAGSFVLISRDNKSNVYTNTIFKTE